ncbi:MAG: hypothetical protein ACJ750_07890 [Gaiellaceae bacterium]
MTGSATPAAFALALLAFVLPFATVSCDESSVEVSGAELVLRSAPETEGFAAAPEGIELGELVVASGGGLATAAFLAFALGLLASARMWRSGWAPIAGAVGVAALIFLKTRGGPEDIAEVDARIGAFLAAGVGAAAALTAGAVWLRAGRPPLRPLAPVIAAGLLLFGYLFPSERSPLVVVAYADTLNLRRPWDGLFWLLPVVVGVLLLARRHGVSRNLAGFAVGVLAVAAADVADEIWGLVQEDDVQPGMAPPAFLAGIVTAGAWAITNEWRALRRPALLPLATGAGVTLAAWLASPAG